MEENRNQETAEMKSSIMELGDMIGKMATAINNTNTVPLVPILPDRVSSWRDVCPPESFFDLGKEIDRALNDVVNERY